MSVPQILLNCRDAAHALRLGRHLAVMPDVPGYLQALWDMSHESDDGHLQDFGLLVERALSAQQRADWLDLADVLEFDMPGLWGFQAPAAGAFPAEKNAPE